jgi:hypothetical protein
MTRCKKCDHDVTWIKVEDRWKCLNYDGTDHWDLCSKLVFEEAKRGKHYIENNGRETTHGYDSNKHGKKAYLMEGIVITGKHYKPTLHEPKCDVPPWEVCDCET